MKFIKHILFLIYKMLFTVMGMLIKKHNKVIIFESFLGKQFSDNPRAIYEYLLDNYPDYRMYWSVERKSVYKLKEHNIKIVKRFSFKWMYLMNRAKFWVTNSRLPLWIPKPKDTVYIQTWHGTPLKKLAVDIDEVRMPGTSTEKYKENFVMEAKKWDYLISPNEYSTEIFKKAFKFEKEIVESGYPRNDYLINENNENVIERIKIETNLPVDKKVILYAPTWRDNQFYGRGRYKFDLQMDLNLLKEKLSNEYIIVLRLHYLIAENLNLTDYEGFVYDLSFHEDIRELYLVADLLITDYSSVFFDYAILKRPMIFYVYDIEEYRDNLRGFYFNIEKHAPGPLVKNTEELIREIKKLNRGYIFDEKINAFNKNFSYLEDGQASERVIKCLMAK